MKVQALLGRLEQEQSARHKGNFALYNCLVLGHTKYKGVQRIYFDPFPKKTFYGSHQMDLVMIRPPGIQPGRFVVSPDLVWYARVLGLFSAIVSTDTGSKSFDALLSTLETYNNPENGNYLNYCNYVQYCTYCHYYFLFIVLGWVNSVGSRIVYELDYRKPVLYVLPIPNILVKLPVVPVGDTGTILHHLLNVFPGPLHPVTASRILEMVAGCGLSARGRWDGPVICNELGGCGRVVMLQVASWRKVPCEHANIHVWSMMPSAIHVLR